MYWQGLNRVKFIGWRNIWGDFVNRIHTTKIHLTAKRVEKPVCCRIDLRTVILWKYVNCSGTWHKKQEKNDYLAHSMKKRGRKVEKLFVLNFPCIVLNVGVQKHNFIVVENNYTFCRTRTNKSFLPKTDNILFGVLWVCFAFPPY